MAQIKMTKNELRDQQRKRSQLERYLPTLRLKKALLQTEVNNAQIELEKLQIIAKEQELDIIKFARLFTHPNASDLEASLKIVEVKIHAENIAGVEIPVFEEVVFEPLTYHLFDTPLWIDSAIKYLRALLSTREHIRVVEQKKAALEKELRDVSIRVNLFEKVLIPRTDVNIKKIKVFLGDQQLSAVAQAKVAKTKIEMRKKEAAA